MKTCFLRFFIRLGLLSLVFGLSPGRAVENAGPLQRASGNGANPPFPDGLSPEIIEAVQWYDALGFPPVKDLARVRVIDSWSDAHHSIVEEIYTDGWLLEEKAGKWRVLAGLDAGVRLTWDAVKPWPLQEWLVTEYEKTEMYQQTVRRHVIKTDFKKEADTMLEELNSRSAPGSLLHPRPSVMSRQMAAFIEGRQCLERGLTEPGMELLRLAQMMDREAKTGRSLREILNDQMATCELWRLTMEFGVPATSRETILTDLELALKRFRTGAATPNLKQMAERLRVMVAEDREHARTVKSLDAMTLAEQAAELVFQLRDQHGQQLSQPGRCDIFSEDDEKAPGRPASPAAQLVMLRMAAVPPLIEALGNDRYSRSVQFWRKNVFSHSVLTVADCAEAVLGRIAQRGFYVQKPAVGTMSREEEVSAKRALVEKWWNGMRLTPR
jgi:hypothetical protein